MVAACSTNGRSLWYTLHQVGNIKFFSATYRLFKLPKGMLEPDCEARHTHIAAALAT